jgi:hypothetical protein
MAIDTLKGRVTENWEAWSNREQVIYQHLESLDKAQEFLGAIISHEALEHHRVKALPDWQELLKWLSKTVMKAHSKRGIIKDKDINKEVQKVYDMMLTGNLLNIKTSECLIVLDAISCMYDDLGYSRAERRIMKSPHISDLADGIMDMEEMEADDMEAIDV